MKDLKEFNEICTCNERPIYKRRYKDNGEEYLEKVDTIDIEEDLKEKKLEIERIKELMQTQQRLKTEELLSESEDEESLNRLKELSDTTAIEDTYQFMNKINEVKEFYNKLPREIRMQYKDLSKFTKEFLPKYVNEKLQNLQKIKDFETEQLQNQKTQQEKINELTEQLKILKERRENNNVQPE